jgi:hypothetical protein
MSNKDRILDFIERCPGRDDDQIAAALTIQPRQTVNRLCRHLTNHGLVQRRVNSQGKLGNYPTVRNEPEPASRDIAKPERAKVSPAPPSYWYWEGNVVDRLAEHLESEGWQIISRADTASKERGVDLQAERSGQTLLVEVKGYPSTSYRDPARAGQHKPTSPTLQAQHWFSHALLKGMRLQNSHPGAAVALAFPAFPRYRALALEVGTGLSKIDLQIILLSESGEVTFVL